MHHKHHKKAIHNFRDKKIKDINYSWTPIVSRDQENSSKNRGFEISGVWNIGGLKYRGFEISGFWKTHE